MSDTDKLVAAILAAGKAAAGGLKTHEDYLKEYDAFVAAIEKRGRENANTSARGAAAAANAEAGR